ncbi:MAG: hypothetical protein BWY21_01528 [Parcubacteria group bacterium ADurb.Bin216]|nr:MAG: hypothetical protein BWY21_01528 [Parcubacteria group bacterium ADurb.Bin216]
MTVGSVGNSGAESQLSTSFVLSPSDTYMFTPSKNVSPFSPEVTSIPLASGVSGTAIIRALPSPITDAVTSLFASVFSLMAVTTSPKVVEPRIAVTTIVSPSTFTCSAAPSLQTNFMSLPCEPYATASSLIPFSPSLISRYACVG